MRITSSIAIASLLLALFWFSSANARMILQFITSAAAVVVAFHAGRARKYSWCAMFSVIVLLYNPIVPLAMGRNINSAIDVFCLLIFGYALIAVHTTPRLTMVSIINEAPRSESL